MFLFFLFLISFFISILSYRYRKANIGFYSLVVFCIAEKVELKISTFWKFHGVIRLLFATVFIVLGLTK